MEDTLTVFTASKYCNVSSKTIINWVEAGHIKAYRTVGGHRRIKKSDLEALCAIRGSPSRKRMKPVTVKRSWWWMTT